MRDVRASEGVVVVAIVSVRAVRDAAMKMWGRSIACFFCKDGFLMRDVYRVNGCWVGM